MALSIFVFLNLIIGPQRLNQITTSLLLRFIIRLVKHHIYLNTSSSLSASTPSLTLCNLLFQFFYHIIYYVFFCNLLFQFFHHIYAPYSYCILIGPLSLNPISTSRNIFSLLKHHLYLNTSSSLSASTPSLTL